MRHSFVLALAILMIVLQPVAAQAYIGPGVGLGAIGSVLGVIGAIFLALFAVIFYPLKRLLKGRRSAQKIAIPKDAGK